jgi:hypothetical protein
MRAKYKSNYAMLDSVSMGKCHRDYINELAHIEGNLTYFLWAARRFYVRKLMANYSSSAVNCSNNLLLTSSITSNLVFLG